MRKILLMSCVLVLLIPMMCQGAEKNMLSNSAFEQADPINPNQPLGWTTKGVCEWNKQGGRNKGACVIAKQSPWSCWLQPVHMQANHKYLISVWMKADKPKAYGQIGFSDTRVKQGKSWRGFKLGASWRYYSFEVEPVKVPSNMRIVLLNENNPANIYFDDVKVVDLTSKASSQPTAVKPIVPKSVPATDSTFNLLKNAGFELADPINTNKPLGWSPTKDEFCEWVNKGKDGTY